jgi:hypothetical protein
MSVFDCSLEMQWIRSLQFLLLQQVYTNGCKMGKKIMQEADPYFGTFKPGMFLKPSRFFHISQSNLSHSL